MRYIGLDYSMSNPSLTILGEDDKFENTKTFFLSSVKKYNYTFGNVTGLLHPDYANSIERYENIASIILQYAKLTPDDMVYLEDYSMGSKGKIFNIAENTMMIKYLMYKSNIPFKVISPTAVKKFFTSKGNSDKNKMYDAFVARTNIDLYAQLHLVRTTKVNSPISDIVDSYALALTGKYM